MVQTHVYVAVNASTLLGLDDLPGELRGYGPLPAERIRRMAMDMKALWSGVLVDDSGVARRLAERRYQPSKRLGEFLRLRDQTCRQPACTRPAERCDIDHLTPHTAGGATNEINCHCFCRRHHRCKHEGSWKVEKGPDDELIWTSPDGIPQTDRLQPIVIPPPKRKSRAKLQPVMSTDDPPPF